MMKLAGYFCLYATLLAATGLILGSAAPAQTQHETSVQSLLGPSSGSPSAVPAAASSAGNTPSSAVVPAKPGPELIGDTYMIRQRYQAAVTAYSNAQPMTAALWDKLGIAYEMLFDTDDAVRCYQQSLKLDPARAEPLNNLATIHESQGYLEKAEQEFREAIRLSPGDAMMFKNLGTDLMKEQKYKEGWDAYQHALALDPDVFSGHHVPVIDEGSSTRELGAMHYYTALACLRAGETDAALQNLRAAVNEGFLSPKKLAKDKNLAALHGNPNFQQILTGDSVQ